MMNRNLVDRSAYIPPCGCRRQPATVEGEELPDGAGSHLKCLINDGPWWWRCEACGQCWSFGFLGRLDAPTWEKIDWQDARKRARAWDDARPQREAEAARREQAKAKAAVEIAAQKLRDARETSRFAVSLQYAALGFIALATVMTLFMMFKGGDPPPPMLAIVGVLWLAAFGMIGGRAWYIRA